MNKKFIFIGFLNLAMDACAMEHKRPLPFVKTWMRRTGDVRAPGDGVKYQEFTDALLKIKFGKYVITAHANGVLKVWSKNEDYEFEIDQIIPAHQAEITRLYSSNKEFVSLDVSGVRKQWGYDEASGAFVWLDRSEFSLN